MERRLSTADSRPKLLFLITEDWFFVSHFIGFAQAARAAGFEPVVACRVAGHAEAIAAAGVRLIDVPAERGSLGVWDVAGAVGRYLSLMRAERPALVHAIALKPVLTGGLAALLAGVPAVVLAPTGLGALWTAEDAKARAVRRAVRTGVGRMALSRRVRWLFENRDDPAALGLEDKGTMTFVAGAGVPADAFPPLPPPAGGPVRVAVVARMIHSKGIAEAVEAVRLARAAGSDIALDLWGEPDPANPAPCTAAELAAWSAEPGISWKGRTSDARAVWREAHIAMLLSRGGEGLPRTLVEAAACARPIVTTDVPGCRDVVRDGVEGFRVPPRDAARAAHALARLAADPDLRAAMGRHARARFERDMTQAAVNSAVEALYRSLRKVG